MFQKRYSQCLASGILYLRCNDSTPDSHEIVVNTPGGTVSYKIPIVKIKDYSLDDMLSKKLFFLIPFYFFNYSLEKMEKDHALIEDMKNTYLKLWDQLESLVQQGKISEFEKSAIKAMCDKVAQSLTNKYDNVKEGVDSVMGGEILDYEAKRIGMKAGMKAILKQCITCLLQMWMNPWYSECTQNSLKLERNVLFLLNT